MPTAARTSSPPAAGPRTCESTGTGRHASEAFMTTMALVAPTLVIAVAATAPAARAGQSAPAPQAPPATVALVETWPDGRVLYELTGPRRAGMWTPRFLRVDGYEPPPGTKPVYAVQLMRSLVGRDIKVEVSVLLGSAEPPGVPVA